MFGNSIVEKQNVSLYIFIGSYKNCYIKKTIGWYIWGMLQQDEIVGETEN